MSTHTSRRSFLKQTGLTGVSLVVARFDLVAATKASPNEKLNIGVIGVAHQGNYNLGNVASENIVALCDVDDTYVADAAKRFPGAKTYNDFRRLLDQKEIEAVVVATPDHTHAVATVAALKSGRHVYCEKPLTHTLSECRKVMDAARNANVATQIGTQIHAGSNYRRAVEIVQGGIIGLVKEVHVWVDATYGGKGRPQATPPVPASLHYDLWLGPVAFRPYSPEYLPGQWRNWWAFGGGALADFGCHYMDLPHWALGLRAPLTARVVAGPPVHVESVPPWLILAYQYPARGSQPPVGLTWYHGGRQPSPDVLSSELAAKYRSGVLFVGSKGRLLCDYGRHELLGDFGGFVPPEPTISDSIGHHAEWIRACKTGAPTTCNFEYSGTLTEAVLLGNVAYRSAATIDWDSKNLRAKNCPQATEFVQHKYRQGWSI
jgi:predicted dehydrogenase